ncbi:MAG: CinA family protein [Candidatus Tectomicrobia bacterium]|nr:CinA family protein [Candidatus Tectomicrobia bacterium]
MGTSVEELAKRLGGELRRRGATLAVAESCTGGALGAAITSVAGASDYFVGGMLAYTARAKWELLGVPAEMLAEHGAVSRELAVAMARRMRLLARTDVAVSVTGNAGPTSDTGSREVGLVYVGVCSGGARGEAVQVAEHRFRGSRAEVQEQAVAAALHLLVAHLTERAEATTS